MLKQMVTLAALCASVPLFAQRTRDFDAAVAFGTRPSISDLSLSPEGASIVYVVPRADRGSAVYTRSLAAGATERLVMTAAGNPDRVTGCDWTSNTRLVCSIYAITYDRAGGRLVPFSRLVAVDADGKNLQLLSKRDSSYGRGLQVSGGEVIDWLPNEDGAILMSRNFLPDEHEGLGSSDQGLGVDRVDTRTLAIRHVERPSENAIEYISDGRGTVRIITVKEIPG
jgi:hypothetical protein